MLRTIGLAAFVGATVGDKQTLAPRAYRPVPLGSTVPGGWLRNQLDAQDAGLCGNHFLGAGGHATDSSWVGGKGYNGLDESYVYWLNGYLPLAVQLGGETKMSEIKSQMDYIFTTAANNTKAQGWLGPLADGSAWSSFRYATCLGQYYEATQDKRVASVFFKYNQVLHDFLVKTPMAIGSWTQVRWQEHVVACQWLLDTFGAAASAEDVDHTWKLMNLLTVQGFNWTGWVASTEQKPWLNASASGPAMKPGQYIENHDISGGDLSSKPLPAGGSPADCEKRCNTTAGCVAYVYAPAKCPPERLKLPGCWLKASVTAASSNPCRNYRVLGESHVKSTIKPWFPTNTHDADMIGTNKWKPKMDRMWTHGVNLGQAMNTWGAMYRLTGDKSYIAAGKAGWEKVMRYHGQASGVFTGDETLSGLPPARGTETCTVVEIMNSAGEMFLTSGDTFYADRLEQIAYNALPAAFMNGTMWSLNYFQQVNKLDAIDGCEAGCTYCFGMVYECCVSNHVQGWPKFSARQFAVKGSNTLAAVQYFESNSSSLILGDGSKVSVAVKTAYPFDETITFTINADKAFSFELRIPAWCKGATVTTGGATVGPTDTTPLPSGAMHAVPVAAGSSTVTLTIPLKVRVVRRPAYAVNATYSVDTNAANIYVGPVLYAAPRDFTLDHSKPYDDTPGLLPVGQPHGQNNYLLGTGNWSYALRISDDSAPENDLVYETVDVPAPPKGQGQFSAFLVPGHIKAKAQLLDQELWSYAQNEYGGRGAPRKCDKGTSIPDYTAVWAGLPPKSPVSGVSSPLIDLMLLPMGATDLRVAEFATTSA